MMSIASASSPPIDSEAGDGEPLCPRCGAANIAANRFCRACGTSLWRRCLSCQAERPIDETYCAQCGQDMVAAERALIEREESHLRQIEQLIERLELQEALTRLNQLVARVQQGCLSGVRQRGESLVADVRELIRQHETRATRHVDQARRLLADYDYAAAATELEQVPPAIRDDEARRLLSQATGAVRETAELKERLRQPQGVPFRDRVAAIERLLELHPRDPRIRQWSVQLRDHVMEAARGKLKDHLYHSAVELLDRLPLSLRNPTTTKLRDEACELSELAVEIQTAPELTEATIGAARRLARLDPENQHVRGELREMLRRQAEAQRDPQGRPPAWRPCPGDSLLKLPVRGYTVPQSLRFATPEIARRFHGEPGRFWVACGLALQLLRRAAVTNNLLNSPDATLLGKLRTAFRERPPVAAWGLDLGQAAVKAVRLSIDADDRVTMTHCVLLPHRCALTRPEAQIDRASIVRETLATFAARGEVGSTDQLGVNWPVARTLARFLRLPAAEGKKLRGMVELEARSQIPFPLEEVRWDTHVFPRSPSLSRLDPTDVLLVAARRRDVEDRVAQLGQAGIPVHLVQCDAVALHNLLQFDRFDTTASGGGGDLPAGFALLDIGTEMATLVVTYPGLLWFRGLRPAADDVIASLARRFAVTRDVAEQLARNPSRAERFRDAQEAMREVFQKLTNQCEGFLTEFGRTFAGGPLQELLVVGGGGRVPGLIRYVRCGR